MNLLENVIAKADWYLFNKSDFDNALHESMILAYLLTVNVGFEGLTFHLYTAFGKEYEYHSSKSIKDTYCERVADLTQYKEEIYCMVWEDVFNPYGTNQFQLGDDLWSDLGSIQTHRFPYNSSDLSFTSVFCKKKYDFSQYQIKIKLEELLAKMLDLRIKKTKIEEYLSLFDSRADISVYIETGPPERAEEQTSHQDIMIAMREELSSLILSKSESDELKKLYEDLKRRYSSEAEERAAMKAALDKLIAEKEELTLLLQRTQEDEAGALVLSSKEGGKRERLKRVGQAALETTKAVVVDIAAETIRRTFFGRFFG